LQYIAQKKNANEYITYISTNICKNKKSYFSLI
jgi:hypothetical protein